MSRPPTKKYTGTNQQGAEHASPYPVSRLAPATELVDLAQVVAQADQTIQSHAVGKLRIIAEQIQQLQAQAHQILQQARHDQELHRARCHAQRIVGKIYHLYRDDHGELYFSLLSPQDWRGQPPHPHQGAYRLETDMSWTPMDNTSAQESIQPILDKLLGQSDL